LLQLYAIAHNRREFVLKVNPRNYAVPFQLRARKRNYFAGGFIQIDQFRRCILIVNSALSRVITSAARRPSRSPPRGFARRHVGRLSPTFSIQVLALVMIPDNG
jgi:hypothetical protein